MLRREILRKETQEVASSTGGANDHVRHALFGCAYEARSLIQGIFAGLRIG